MATTNKEILSIILNNQQEQAKKHLQLSADFSSFMNKQSEVNQRVLSLLETDTKTNQKGVIEKVSDIDNRVLKLETDHKITKGKIAVGVFLLTSLGGFISWLLGIFDN